MAWRCLCRSASARHTAEWRCPRRIALIVTMAPQTSHGKGRGPPPRMWSAVSTWQKQKCRRMVLRVVAPPVHPSTGHSMKDKTRTSYLSRNSECWSFGRMRSAGAQKNTSPRRGGCIWSKLASSVKTNIIFLPASMRLM